MKTVNITIKKEDGWNRVNRINIKRVVENSVITCDGHYTDDYAWDSSRNYGQNAKSEGCKAKILSDFENDNCKYIELYWCNRNKEFIIYYGQWLSYTAKVNSDLKLNFKRKTETKEINKNVKLLAEQLEKKLLLELKVHKVDCQGNRDNAKTSVKIRRKYYAVDSGGSGKFLVDQEDNVYSIKGYGQRGYYLGHIMQVCNRLEQDIENLNKMLNEEVRACAINY